MSLANIKSRLATNLTVSGVKRVYTDLPEVAPIEADCPAVLMDRQDNFLTCEAWTNDTVKYSWQFRILFLLKPAGTGTIDEWDDAIEPYPARIVTALWGDMTLNGYATMPQGNNNFDIGIIEYKGVRYFGFETTHTVVEQITTTMA